MSASPCAPRIDDFVTVVPVPPQTEKRRGIVRFIGDTHFAPGKWIGVELIGSLGRNDGSVQGKAYFTCLPGQGVFVRPELVLPYSPSDHENGGDSSEGFVEASASVALVHVLQKNVIRLQEELELRDKALQCLTAQRSEETMGEKEKPKATEEKPTQSDEPDELLRLRQEFAELCDICKMQEDELHQQTSHVETLHQIVDELRRDREALQQSVQRLEAEQRSRASANPIQKETVEETNVETAEESTVEAVEETKVETAEESKVEAAEESKVEAAEESKVEAAEGVSQRQEAFQSTHEREALRQLKQRYDELFAAREAERGAAEARLKSAAAEYEEALAQQRDFKERLANDVRELRRSEAEGRAEIERIRAIRAPMSALEREMHGALVRRLQSELMESHALKFVHRYSVVERPAATVSPADALAATAKALDAAGAVMSFSTPEACRSARLKLFGCKDTSKENELCLVQLKEMHAASDFAHLSLDVAAGEEGGSEVDPLSRNSTGEVFTRALQNFRELLFERIGQHEDEVFSLRARFQLRRDEDRAHFERAQRKRRRAQALDGRRRRTHAVHSRTSRASSEVRSPSPEGLADEVVDEEQGRFEADQKKLCVEHEEELQQQFPLAFLEDAGASVMAFSLIPMLKSTMLSLSHSRTERHKEMFSTSSETTAHDKAEDEGDALQEKQLCQVSGKAVTLKEKQQEQGGGTKKGSQSFAVVKDEDEHQRPAAVPSIGRGAFIVPMYVERGGSGEAKAQQSEPLVAKYHCVGPEWAARLITSGAAEFARLAMESSVARDVELLRKSREYVENVSLVAQHARATRLLAEIRAEELRLAAAHEEKKKVWQQAVQAIPHSTNSTQQEDTLEKEKKQGGNTGGNSQTRKNSELGGGPSEVKGTEIAVNVPLAASMPPTNLICAQRRVRMERLTGPSLPFDTEYWSEITLDSDNELETRARAYMWPQRLEDRVPHVLCGEARRNVRRWLIARPKKAKEEQGQMQKAEDERGESEDDREEEDDSHPDVVAVPRVARNVWLSVDGIGEFVAHEFRFAGN